MTVEIMALCNGAYIDPEHGLLTCRQSFDAITAPEMPYLHAYMAVALRIRFSATEQGSRRVKLVLARPGADPVDLALTMFRFKVPDGASTGVHQSVTDVMNMEFEEPGIYELVLSVDRERRAAVPITVKLRR